MNLPENLSTTANSLYSLLSADQSPKTTAQLAEAFAQQPAGEERHKAVATADSLVVKGIINVDKGAGEATYTLLKSSSEVGPNEDADAKEEYVEKTDANAEEERMIAILESHNKTLPEEELFDLYEKGQLPATKSDEAASDIEAALKELEDAGVVSKEGERYSIKK